MSRLTKKYEDNSGYYAIENYGSVSQITLYDYPYEDMEKCINKLGEIEDLMEYYHIETLEQLKQVMDFPLIVENKEYDMCLGNISCFTDKNGKPKVVKPQYVSLAQEMVKMIFQEALSEFKEGSDNE